jgi:hypothetical protein
MQLRQIDSTARGASRFRFEGPANVTDFTNFLGANLADNRTAIGQDINDSHPGQFDQGLTDGSMTDSEGGGELLRYEALTGAKLSLKDIGQQGSHDRLSTEPMIAINRMLGRQVGHDNAKAKFEKGKEVLAVWLIIVATERQGK